MTSEFRSLPPEMPPNTDSASAQGQSPAMDEREIVTAQAVWSTPAFAVWERRLLLFFGVAILGLVGVARLLPPDPSGMGTHRRLGLPACGSEIMWGIPCPSCGMTTSWAWMTRGELVHSWNANPGGLALGMFVLVMAPWMIASGVKGHWWPLECQPRYVLAAGMTVILITLVQWFLRIQG